MEQAARRGFGFIKGQGSHCTFAMTIYAAKLLCTAGVWSKPIVIAASIIGATLPITAETRSAFRLVAQKLYIVIVTRTQLTVMLAMSMSSMR